MLDNSPRQLARDQEVAEREGLDLHTVLGDMRDLSAFPDASFDVVVNPVSNVFCPELAPVWREAFRVLRPGGLLLAGFMNPDIFIFDVAALDERGELVVRHPLPFSTLDLPDAERQRVYGDGAGRVQPLADRADRRPAGGGLQPHPPGRGAASRGRHGAVHARLHRHPRGPAAAGLAWPCEYVAGIRQMTSAPRPRRITSWGPSTATRSWQRSWTGSNRAVAARVEARLATMRQASARRANRRTLLTGLAVGACSGALAAGLAVAGLNSGSADPAQGRVPPNVHVHLLPAYLPGNVIAPPRMHRPGGG